MGRRVGARGLISGLALAALAFASPAAACPTAVDGLDLTRATLPEQRAALGDGTTTSVDLVTGYLERIEALNRQGPKLKPVIVTAPDALEQAAAADAARASGFVGGPLFGIPVLLKDNLDTTDFETTAGAVAMEGPPPPSDAFLVSRLREAGAIVLGKANMAEWATTIGTDQPLGFSDVGGRMHNPYTMGDPSGSSGGSAISAASGLASSTVGTETAGSIILPSFINSAVGLKPTRGLVSRGGVIPLLAQNDTPGPIDQNVTDAAEMLGLMTGVDPRDPVTARQEGRAFTDYTQFLDPNALEGARIGIQKEVRVRTPEDEIFTIPGLDEIRRVLEEAGAEVVELDDTLRVKGGNPADVRTSFLAQFRAQLNRYLADRGPTSPMGSMEEIVAFNRRGGKAVVRYGQASLIEAVNSSPIQRRRAKSRLARVKNDSREAMLAALDGENLDALVTSLGASSVTNTFAGFPAITVPAGYVDGTPFGVVFTGRRWSEPDLIGYGYAYEQASQAWRSPATINPKFAAACAG